MSAQKIWEASATAGRSLCVQHRLQASCVTHRKGFPVVVEVREDLCPAAPLADAPLPRAQLALRVVAAPAARTLVEADEGPVRGDLVGLEGPRGMVADDERDTVLAQQRVHVR